MFMATSFTIAKTWKESKYTQIDQWIFKNMGYIHKDTCMQWNIWRGQ